MVHFVTQLEMGNVEIVVGVQECNVSRDMHGWDLGGP